MNHLTTPEFWDCFERLPDQVQKLARKNFELLKEDVSHPSLHFKKVGTVWSARVGLQYRTLDIQQGGAYIWFWIGCHAEYDKMLG